MISLKKILTDLSLVLALWASASCSNQVEKESGKLKEFCFIYNLNNIDLFKREKADSLLGGIVYFPTDSNKRIVCLSRGDCSVCLYNLLDFIKSNCEDLNDMPINVLLKSSSTDLLDFYLSKSMKEMNIQQQHFIKSLRVIPISDKSSSEDGVYLIVSNRIVKYAPFEYF